MIDFRAVLAALFVAVLGLPAFAAAQGSTGPSVDSTGTLVVRVYRQRDSVPVAGVFIRSGRIASVTGADGVARLTLAARLWSVTVSHPEFEPSTFEMTVLPNVSQDADIYLRNGTGFDLTPLSSVTRIVGSPEIKESLARRRFDGDAVVRAIQRRPGDLLGLFSGTAVRLQPLGGALDATRLRVNGLPLPSAGLLLDGAPVYGGRPGGFGLFQLTPTDLAGAELLAGSATALHGPAFAAGALNLLSRRPGEDHGRLGVSQSSEKGGDVVFWGSRRFAPTATGALALDFHQQRLVDADDDGWGEFPRAIRFSARPRLYLDRPNGDGIMVTAGASSEDRAGGFLTSPTDPNPYREERRTGRADLGFEAHRLDGHGGRLHTRISAAFQSTNHRFDALRERDKRYHGFAEVGYGRPVGQASIVVGAAFQYEALRQRDLPLFDYTHQFPSVFGRVTLALAPRIVGSISGRCDRHNVHGLQCMPRAAVLYQPTERLDARLSYADGYFAPTSLAAEVEVVGLRATVPVATKAERVRSASFDLSMTGETVRFAASLNYSRVALPVRLVPFPGDPDRRLRLINVGEPTRVFSGELSGEYHGRAVSVRGFYGFLDGTEGVPESTGRRDLDHSPRHSLGGSVSWRPVMPAEPMAMLELNYIGSQSVYDNPFLSQTPGYAVVHGMASLRSGRARLYLNGENLFDKKLRQYHDVLLPVAVEGGRRTMAPWAPLRGRVISIGALVDW